MGRWNWWAPGPLGRLADRLGFSHAEDEPDGATAAGQGEGDADGGTDGGEVGRPATGLAGS
jgi:RND superfamily putative drug exporter